MDLREYADDLQNCCESLRALGALGELRSQSSLVALVRKLPAHLQGRWRDVVYDRPEGKGRTAPEFGDIVRFVGREAAIASDPVYGTVGLKSGRTDRTP